MSNRYAKYGQKWCHTCRALQQTPPGAALASWCFSDPAFWPWPHSSPSPSSAPPGASMPLAASILGLHQNTDPYISLSCLHPLLLPTARWVNCIGPPAQVEGSLRMSCRLTNTQSHDLSLLFEFAGVSKRMSVTVLKSSSTDIHDKGLIHLHLDTTWLGLHSGNHPHNSRLLCHNSEIALTAQHLHSHSWTKKRGGQKREEVCSPVLEAALSNICRCSLKLKPPLCIFRCSPDSVLMTSGKHQCLNMCCQLCQKHMLKLLQHDQHGTIWIAHQYGTGFRQLIFFTRCSLKSVPLT